MKKILFSLIAVIAGTMGSFAQSALVATLSHGSNLTPYYGESAFVDAYAAAVDGDCITLSAGAFTTVESIEKAITVRGAGSNGDESLGTTLNGRFQIKIDEKHNYAVILEGLRGDCRCIYGALSQDAQLIQVYFTGDVYFYGCSPNCKSCIFSGSTGLEQSSTNVVFDNCVVTYPVVRNVGSGFILRNSIINSHVNQLYNSSLSNCIIIGWDPNYNSHPLNNTNSAEYCVGIVTYEGYFVDPTTANHFSEINSTTNRMVTDVNSLFKNYNGSSSLLSGTYFELTDAAKAQYKGSDGTEVGIFGGANPYSTATTNPRITNFSITTNTEDGQLKVKLNVE